MLNNVVLVGRLTKDPDLRFTSNGTATATFNLAVNRSFKNASGEREADFVNCVIWRKPAETLANYAHKGTLLGVTGRIQTRNYENRQGQRIYVTEVIVERWHKLSWDDESKVNQTQQSAPTNSFKDYSKESQNNSSFGSSNQVDVNDDDLPF